MADNKKIRKFTSVAKRLILIVILFYVATCFYFWSTQVDKIIKPIAGVPVTAKSLPDQCELLKLGFEADGANASLDAFWLEPVPADSSAQTPVVLLLHGQGTTITRELARAQEFVQLGCQVLLPEYRGFGSSLGKYRPREESLTQDAEASLKYLKSSGIPSQQILIYGHSLGGAVAIDLAQRHPEVAGLIVESTFTSVQDMSALRYQGLLNLLPVRLLLTEEFDSYSKLRDLSPPVLFVHGEQDTMVPAYMSERLFEATSAPKVICKIDGAGHADCRLVDQALYRRSILSFIQQSTSAAAALAQ